MARKEKSLAEKIVDVILADMTDRRGLRQEWDQIDDDIQKEIRSDWIRIIEKELGLVKGG